MTPPHDTVSERGVLRRFSTGERWVHRTLGILLGVLMVTAALLYFPWLGGIVGNRRTVRLIHEVAGWIVLVPLALALLSKAFRADARRLNRFAPTDWEWQRSRDRRTGRIAVGKFNAGQKLNAAFTLGSILVLSGTGAIMFFSSAFPDDIRTRFSDVWGQDPVLARVQEIEDFTNLPPKLAERVAKVEAVGKKK